MIKKKYYICVTPFFPTPNSWRGAYVLDQVKAIIRNSDYEVCVFMGDNKNLFDYEIDGIKVYRYKTHEMPSNILNGLFNGYNARSFVKKVLQIGINPQDVAFVHCHVSMRAACGLALNMLNPRIKVLLQHHDLDPFNLRSGTLLRNNRFNIRYRAKKSMALYNKVDLHICISEACRDSLLAFPDARKGEIFEEYLNVISKAKGLPHVKAKDIYVLYNGVDTKLFNTGAKKNTKQETKDVFRIGCIANFQELKGHMTLIKAFEELHKKGYSDIVLSLLGTGETRRMCEDYLCEHDLSRYVEWPKEVSHDKLPEYYNTLDLFVLPSYFEGFGCVFTEAYACSVPYMGCVNQGYSEYVFDKDKWLILPKDYMQLAKIIEVQYLEGNVQKLSKPIDIDILVSDYLHYLSHKI